jgi:hypothetical protein
VRGALFAAWAGRRRAAPATLAQPSPPPPKLRPCVETKQKTLPNKHTQIFFSRRCPLIQGRLPLLHKLLYTNGTCE